MTKVTFDRAMVLVQDYATIHEQISYSPTMHCLSATTVMLLLGVAEYLRWPTRYIGDVDQDTIQGWYETAMAELTGGTCLEDFCAAMVEAIAECGNVQIAITEYVSNSGGGSNTGTPGILLPVSTLEGNMLPDDYTCDADHRYGMAVEIVNHVHDATLEFLEAMEVLTDPLDLVRYVLDEIPIFSLLGLAIEVILWMQDTLVDVYVAAWSQAVLDEIACDLFCRMVVSGECVLTPKIIWETYLDFPHTTPPSIDAGFDAWVAWIMTLPMDVNVSTVKGTGLIGVLAMLYGGKFAEFAYGLRSLDIVIKLSADETNSDHSVLCDECGWYHIIDFTVENGGFIPDPASSPTYGEWIEGVGWKPTDALKGGYWERNCILIRNFSPSVDFTKVRMEYDVARGNYADNWDCQVLQVSAPIYEQRDQHPQPGGYQEMEIEPSTDLYESMILLVRPSIMAAQEDLSGDVSITKLHIWGNGTNPFL